MLQVQKPRRIWPLRLISWLFDASPRWLYCTAVALAVTLAVLTFWQGHSIKTEIKSWHARRMVAEAQELISEQVTRREGVRLLLDAWQLSPEDPQVVRALARASSEIGLPHYARFFYTQLPRFEPLTPADELDLASALARLSDHTGARIVLDEFQRVHGETPELWRAHATLATQAGDAAAARAAMQKVIQITPDDTVAHVHHAASLASSEDARQQAAGIDALLDQLEKALLTGDVDGRNHCFWALAELPLIDPARRERFSHLIGRMPWLDREREVTRHLLGYPLPLREDSRKDLRSWLREMLRRDGPVLTVTDRVAIARLLQRHDEHLLCLEVIPHEIALQEAALCAARLDSLMAERLTSQAAQLVNSPSVPVQRHVQALFQAWIVLEEEGHSSRAVKRLGEALEEARDHERQGAFIAIAHLARRFQLHRVASEALTEAFSPQFPVATHLLPELLDSARQGGSSATETLRLVARREHLEPWNLDLRRQASCLRLLCGEEVEHILEESRGALDADPTNVYAAFLAAYACHRLRLHAEAARYLEKLRQPRAWLPHERAAMTAILLAAREEALAMQMAASVSADTPLFPEERRLMTWR